MHKPTVCVFHENDYFVRELTSNLSPQHIIVRHYHFIRELPEVLSGMSNALCCVVQADFDSFPQLEAYRELLKNQGQSGVPIYFLAFGDDMQESLQQLVSENDKIYNSNIRIDRLAIDILNLAPRFTAGSGGTIAHSAYGSTEQFELPVVLDFLQQRSFSGKLCLQKREQAGEIFLDRGRIVEVNYKALETRAALAELMNWSEAVFHLEERIYSLDDISEFSKTLTAEAELSFKDILIDLFYFMHNHFGGENTQQTLRIIIEDKINGASASDLADLHLIYNPRRQEKLQIIGEVADLQVKALLNLFEEIYSDLSGNKPGMTFEQFANSLQELRPYLKRLNRIRPLINEEETPNTLPMQNHQSA